MDGSLFVVGSFVMACCARVPRLPCAGESLRAETFSAEPGGKGFNMALGARRLGAHVECLVATGDDLFGQLAVPAFVSAGLSPALLRKVTHAATGAGIGFIAASGENCLAVHPGANFALCVADVVPHAELIRAAELTLATFEIDDGPIVAAFAIAREAGRRTLLNPSPFRPLSLDLLAVTSLLVVNEGEGAMLARSLGLVLDATSLDSLTALSTALITMGVECLVVTLGAKGALATMRDLVLRQPAFSVAVVDTLGAGDAFVAGLATTLAAGGDLSEALRRGAAAGALTATKPGTFTALPVSAAVEALMRSSHEPETVPLTP